MKLNELSDLVGAKKRKGRESVEVSVQAQVKHQAEV